MLFISYGGMKNKISQVILSFYGCYVGMSGIYYHDNFNQDNKAL